MRDAHVAPVQGPAMAAWAWPVVGSIGLVILFATAAMVLANVSNTPGDPMGLMVVENATNPSAHSQTLQQDHDHAAASASVATPSVATLATERHRAAIASPVSPASASAASVDESSSKSAAQSVSHASRSASREVSQAAHAQAVEAQAIKMDNQGRPTFNGRLLVKVREIQMTTTAYSPDAKSCGKWADGVTASGYSVWTNGMRLVAADTDVLPFKTIITVPGYNGDKPVQVLDRGGAIKGHRLDLLYGTHERALKWGRQESTVTVWKYAD